MTITISDSNAAVLESILQEREALLDLGEQLLNVTSHEEDVQVRKQLRALIHQARAREGRAA
jgi:hypothetical protein